MVVRPLLVTLVLLLVVALSPPFCALWAEVPLVERTLRLDWVVVPVLPEVEREVVERRIWVPGAGVAEEELEVPLVERRTVVPVLLEVVAPDPVEVVPEERRTELEEPFEEELLLELEVPLPLLIWVDEEGVEAELLVELELPEELTVLEEEPLEERTVLVERLVFLF